ncbi:MAG: ComEC/Rec2 family competence protein [Dehalococcoidia bacterium]
MRTLVLAGTWLAALVALPSGHVWLQIAAGIGAVTVSILAYRDRRGVFLAGAALAVMLLASVRWQSATTPPPPDSIAWWANGSRWAIEGSIRARPEVRGATQRFVVDVTSLDGANGRITVTGSVQVRTSVSRDFRAGDTVRIDGVLEPPPRIDEFDYAAYLARRGIFALVEFPRVQVTGHVDRAGIAGLVESIQQRGHDALWKSLPAAQAALAEGILLGRRSEIPRDINDDFNRAGISHLIVISGFNIALVGSVVVGATASLVGRRWAGVLALATIAAYSVLVGLTPPVARATVMGSVVVLAMLSGRPHGAGVTLLLAAALLTVHDPRILSDLSFQLSFAATAGLIVLTPPLLAYGRRLFSDAAPSGTLSWRSLVIAVWDILAVTLAATVATLPLLLYNFGRLSTISPLANLLLVPLFPLVLVTGGIGLAAAMLVPAAATLALIPLGVLLDLSLTIARICAALPGASLTVRGVGELQVLIAYAALAALAFIRIPRSAVGLPDVAINAPASLGAAFPILALVPPLLLSIALITSIVQQGSAPTGVRLDVLGLAGLPATLVTLPGGGRLLVDSGLAPGEVRAALDRLTPRNHAALSAVVVTRNTPSAIGGLGEVIERYQVPLLLVPPEVEDSPWVEAVRSNGVEVVVLRDGMAIGSGGALLQAERSSEPGRWTVMLQYGRQTIDLSGATGSAGLMREGRNSFVYATDGVLWLQTEVRAGESVTLMSDGETVNLRPRRGRTVTARPCIVTPCGPSTSPRRQRTRGRRHAAAKRWPCQRPDTVVHDHHGRAVLCRRLSPDRRWQNAGAVRRLGRGPGTAAQARLR